MAGIDDTKIKMIQLECIIASKDKEISLLREQLSQDEEEVVQKLQQENEALKQQLKHPKQQQGRDSSSASTHANGISSGSRGVSRSGIVDLNVGGTVVTTSVTALQQVPGSKLSTMFDPNHMHTMPQDSQGRVFLPYEADAFAALLSLLHASSVFGRASRAYTHLVRQHNPSAQPYLSDLIQHLGLQALLEPHPSVQHYAAGQHASAAGSSGSGSNAAAGAAAAAAAAGRAVGDGYGKSDRPDSRGRTSGSGSGGGSGSGAAAGTGGGSGPSRMRRNSSPNGRPAAAAGGGGGSSGGAASGGGDRSRGDHKGRGHAQHGTSHDKQQQQQHADPQAEARVAASAAAAQSAALQALTGRGPGGSAGGAAPESNGPALPADMVASAALKGLRQQPKGGRNSTSTDVLKD